jgi:phage gp29-like protein
MRHYLRRAAYAFARVLGAGAAFERAPRGIVNARVMPDLALWAAFNRIGGGLTPQQVSSIIRDADTGDITRLMDLANDARQKDGHLQSVLGTSEESIAELEWQLVLPENAKARDKRAAKAVEDWLRACKGDAGTEKKGLADLIAHLAGAVFYGHAVSETLFRKRDGYIVPAAFDLLAPRRFKYRPRDGRLVWCDQGMPYDGVDFRADYPFRFIVSQPRVTGDVPCREGLVRVLMWAALFRNWTMTDWLRTAEMSWKPWRTATYDKDASDEDIADLETVLERLTTSGYAALPETTKLDVGWPSGNQQSGGAHPVLFDTVGKEMSKAVLGNTEVVESSQSSGYAQAKVGHTVSRTLIRSRARHIAEVLTRDLVRPLIEMNFGRGVAVPEWRFITKDPVDLKAFGEGIEKLVNAGAEIPQSYVRTTVGIPERKGDEPLLVPPKAAPALPAAAPKPEASPPADPEPPPSPSEDAVDPTDPNDDADPSEDG